MSGPRIVSCWLHHREMHTDIFGDVRLGSHIALPTDLGARLAADVQRLYRVYRNSLAGLLVWDAHQTGQIPGDPDMHMTVILESLPLGQRASLTIGTQNEALQDWITRGGRYR